MLRRFVLVTISAVIPLLIIGSADADEPSAIVKLNESARQVFAQGASSPRTGASSIATAASRSCDKLFDETEKLVRLYYPRAKFKRTATELHFEFKSRIDLVRPPEKNGEAQPEVKETVADWGGVVGDLELIAGKYSGIENMPLLLKNRSSYEVYLNAPYSQKYDVYLSVRLAYPFDVNPDFLKGFKDKSTNFENDL